MLVFVVVVFVLKKPWKTAENLQAIGRIPLKKSANPVIVRNFFFTSELVSNLIYQRIKWLKSWRFELDPFVLANQGIAVRWVWFSYVEKA